MENFILHVLSWNVATKHPSEELDFKQLLGLEASDSSYTNIPDLYVIGFQEVKAQPQNIVWDTLFEDPWTARVRGTLCNLGFVKVQTSRLQGLITSVFIKRAHLIYLRDIEALYTRRGLGGIWGNKGATSIRLGIHGCSICFVNSHLTAHDELNNERIQDYKNILNGQVFSIKETSNILFHDYVFWFGDLNFRLNGFRESKDIIEMVAKGELTSLLQDDQLNNVRRTGEAFSELREMPITFPPTYKFESGYDSYDAKRRPAWTDRILYQVNADVYDNVTLNVEALKYRSHLNYRTSDHRPVSAAFNIKTFRKTVETLVEFEEIPVWKLGESNKVFFKVKTTVDTSPQDWIAIYRYDFSSLDHYVAYSYLQASTISTGQEEDNSDRPLEHYVIFSENSISTEGSYVALYISAEPRSVYGMSNNFEAITF